MIKGRCQRAVKLIAQRYWDNNNVTTHREIADKCGLQKSSVKELTKKYRKEQEVYL